MGTIISNQLNEYCVAIDKNFVLRGLADSICEPMEWVTKLDDKFDINGGWEGPSAEDLTNIFMRMNRNPCELKNYVEFAFYDVTGSSLGSQVAILLTKMTKLKEVRIGRTEFGSKTASKVIKALVTSGAPVETLQISEMAYSGDAKEDATELTTALTTYLETSSNLQLLMISSCEFGGDSMETLTKSMLKSSLQNIQVLMPCLDDEICQAFLPVVKGLSSLDKLVLSTAWSSCSEETRSELSTAGLANDVTVNLR
jgi:hypothetical protein